jgi:hypothetical protein
VRRALYFAQLSRAAPGLYTERQIAWDVSLAWGRALIHAAALLDGHPMVWPDQRLSKKGRWWGKVKEYLRGNDRDDRQLPATSRPESKSDENSG